MKERVPVRVESDEKEMEKRKEIMKKKRKRD